VAARYRGRDFSGERSANQQGTRSAVSALAFCRTGWFGPRFGATSIFLIAGEKARIVSPEGFSIQVDLEH
jgi:hypothetical protein